jgi:hypothetical protein
MPPKGPVGEPETVPKWDTPFTEAAQRNVGDGVQGWGVKPDEDIRKRGGEVTTGQREMV